MKKGSKHSQETKRLLSEKRKQYLKNHPQFSTHQHEKKESYAERYFRIILQDNKIPFMQEVGVSIYRLDFLIGNVDLEIDGRQHYQDPKIIESDKKRTAFLKENGFIVKRINWSQYQCLGVKEKEEYIKQLLLFLKNSEVCKFPIIENKIRLKLFQNKKCQVCGAYLPANRITFCSQKCQRTFQGNSVPTKEDLINAINIYGKNMTHLGKHYGVTDNAVKKWLKKYGLYTRKYKMRKCDMTM